MNIIVAFRGVKCTGVDGNRVQLAGRSRNGKYGHECIVGSIGFNGNGYVRHPMGQDWSGSESLLKSIEGRTTLIGEVPRNTLAGETHKRNGDF